MAARVHFAPATGVVSTPAPLRDLPLKEYCVLGVRPVEAHAATLCCQPLFVPFVELARYIPDVPDVNLLGVFEGATVMLLAPMPEKVRLVTGSISVYFAPVAGVVSRMDPLRDFALNAYKVFADKPLEAQALLFCCQPEFVPAVELAK